MSTDSLIAIIMSASLLGLLRTLTVESEGTVTVAGELDTPGVVGTGSGLREGVGVGFGDCVGEGDGEATIT